MLLSFKTNFCNDGEHEQLTSENNELSLTVR
jgi:hypothetical protein